MTPRDLLCAAIGFIVWCIVLAIRGWWTGLSDRIDGIEERLAEKVSAKTIDARLTFLSEMNKRLYQLELGTVADRAMADCPPQRRKDDAREKQG